MKSALMTATVVGLGASGLAAPVHASTVWNGWVNGFGSSEITYTLRCRNGQVITRTSNTQSGTDSCDDGSNSISWNYGAFWRKDTRSNDRKNVVANANLRTDAQLINSGTVMVLQGNASSDDNARMQIAVLTVPGSQIPPGPPRSVDALIAGGFISASHVKFRRDYTGPFTDTLNQTIQLDGQFNDQNVIIYQYGQLLAAVPTMSEWGLITLGGLTAMAGVFMIMRRRTA